MKTAATPVEAAVDSVAATSERTAGAAPEPTAPLIEDTPASAGGNAQVGLVSGNRPTGAPTPFQMAETVNPVAVRKADRPVGRTDNLRQAAQAVLAAWDTNARHNEGVGNAMDGPLAALRGAFVSARPIGNDSCSLKDTKQAQVIAMLGREGGASGPQIAEAMGWAAHTVRGFFAGLAKKGIAVEVLERVRQVGPNKAGAKGSYTVYHLAMAPQA